MNFTMSNAARFLGKTETPGTQKPEICSICHMPGNHMTPDGKTHISPDTTLDSFGNSTVAKTSAPAALQTAAKALQFITAGNAYFTVRSQKTGTRYTYRINVSKPNEKYKQATTFVSLLTGPQNTEDYSYLGMISNGQFRLTRASRMKADSIPVKAFQWVWSALQAGKLPPSTEIWHEGRCGRCGRKLTVPESIEAGIGPECAGKVGL